MDRIELAERLANIWHLSRTYAGKSQEYMAKALGVSKKTVQNWEAGTSSPSQITGFEWFKTLDLQPLPYYLSILYPDKFANLSHQSDDKEIDEALFCIIKDLPSDFKRKLLYFLSGDHGSSPLAMMEMITAHLQAPLRDRVNVAQSIALNYEIAKTSGRIMRPDHIQPDMAFLINAIDNGKDSVIKGCNTYTML